MNEFSALDQRFMQRALELAQRSQSLSEVPVGALLVLGETVLAEGFNTPISDHDATAHAEIQAIRAACKVQGNYRLPDTTLYTTLEPCAMCAGAIVHARVMRVVIATPEPRAGAAGSTMNVLQNQQLNHQCQVAFGLYQEISAEMLKSFFKSKR